MAVILCYRAPDGDIQTFIDNIKCALTRTYAIYEHIIVVGDFNLPNVKGCHDSVIHNISESEAIILRYYELIFSYPG